MPRAAWGQELPDREAGPPNHRRRTVLLVVAAALLLGAANLQFQTVGPPSLERHPEFRSVDPGLRARILDKLRQDKHWLPGAEKKALVPGCTPVALLSALCELHPRATSLVSYTEYFRDEEAQPIGSFIAARRDPTLNPLLLRLALDEDLGAPPRLAAIVGICWPGNHKVLPDLVSAIADPERDLTFRKVLLFRLHRIAASPGPELRELLYIPYDRLDVPVAATLALLGEPIAPSLVLEGLHRDPKWADSTTHLSLRAAGAIAAGDPEMSALVRMALPHMEKRSWSSKLGESSEETKRLRRVTLEAAGKQFARWLEAHPDAHQSRFEMERAAWREARLESFDDILNTPEGDLDFGSAALSLTHESDSGWARDLDRLNRLATLFRRELRGIEGPRERLEVLHRRLLTRHMTLRGPKLAPSLSSYLGDVLFDRAGNCVGLTSLYVALGERLNLPLVAVGIPRHVFLRYDDGCKHLDVELTEMGRLRTVGDLDGAIPRVLGKRELLSVVLSNRSSDWLHSPFAKDELRRPRGRECAEQSIRLDPRNAAAHICLAQALATGDPGITERAMAAIRQAMALDPASPAAGSIGADILAQAERHEEALGLYDRVIEASPSYMPAQAGRLRTLLALGRHEQVIADADAILEKDPEILDVLLSRYSALLELEEPRWRSELAALARGEPVARWELTMETAKTLLGDGRAGQADAAAALELLRGLTVLHDLIGVRERGSPRLVEGPDGQRWFVRVETVERTWVEVRRLEAQALDALGRKAEADEIRRGLPD